jgi:hypothetical protein
MESTPQSTINHNAVIEFASDFDVSRNAPLDREAAGTQKRRLASPMSENCLNSARTMPKSTWRRNAMKV